MSTPDFKQKCDEIHTILCYLDDNENIPVADIYETVNVWFGHVNIKWNDFVRCSTLMCAIMFMDSRNEISGLEIDIAFSADKWTL